MGESMDLFIYYRDFRCTESLSMIGDNMNYSAATYIIICVFIIYLFDVFKVQSFRLNNIDLKKSVAIKIFQLIKGLAVVAYTVIPWGHTLWGTRVIRSNFFIGSIR